MEAAFVAPLLEPLLVKHQQAIQTDPQPR